jgi:hypothetical protein
MMGSGHVSKYLNSSPFEKEEFEMPPESDIQFTDDPVIKDFINLSQTGSRPTKTS